MRVEVRAKLTVPKYGNAPEECEDVVAVGDVRVAVSDGATTSSYSREWAQLLADRYVEQPPRRVDAGWLAPIQESFAADRARVPLPWYAEAKLEEGTYATLLGLDFDLDHGCWSALAVGDTCAFCIFEGRLRHSLPLHASAAFSNRPFLVGTRGAHGLDKPGRQFRHRRRPLVPGMTFVVATDALAAWCWRMVEAGNPPWDMLLRIGDISSLMSHVAAERASGAMRNDDVALAIVEIKP